MRGLIRLLALVATLLPALAGTASPLAAQEADVPPPLTERFALPETERLLSLSPDGTLAVSIARGEDSLCTWSVPSGDQVACADLEADRINLRYEDVTWSPDSRTLAFAEDAMVTLIDGDLWLMDAATGALTNLTDDGFEGKLPFFDEDAPEKPIPVDIAPAWSPDSARIAFSRTIFSGPDEPTPSELWVADVASGETRRVAIVDPEMMGTLYFTMAWSPDGTTIYASVSDFQANLLTDGIWAFDVETGDGEQLLKPDLAYGNDSPAVLSLASTGDLMTVYYPGYLNTRSGDGAGYAVYSISGNEATPIEAPAQLVDDADSVIIAPTIAPDGRTLLYGLSRSEEPAGLIIAHDFTTGEAHPLFTLPEGETPFSLDRGEPLRITPDGALFIQTDITSGYLARLPAEYLAVETDATAPLTATPAAGQAAPGAQTTYEPAAARILAYAPDGRMVAGTPELRQSALCTYAVPSGEEIACANLEEGRIRLNIADVSWSPDSSRIVFAERPFLDYVDGDLWIMDAATGELTNVADDGYDGTIPFIDDIEVDSPVLVDVLPRWSPDGGTLAFSRTIVTAAGEPRPSELWVVDVASGAARSIARVAENEAGALYHNLAWGPDGKTVYASLVRVDQASPENGVWAFDVETGEREQIAGVTERFEGAIPAVMAASPRGDYLTLFYPKYIGELTRPEGGYALLNLETGTIEPLPLPRNLESGLLPVNSLSPGFSPDGASVVYGVRRFEEPYNTLVIADLDTGETEMVADIPEAFVPYVPTIQDGIRIDEQGVAFVLTGVNTGLLVPVPQAGQEAPPIADTPPIEPENATPAATGDDPGAGTATIGDEETDMYATPSFDGPVVLNLGPGDELDVIGEPVTNDEGVWIPVRDPDTRTIGYVSQDDLGE